MITEKVKEIVRKAYYNPENPLPAHTFDRHITSVVKYAKKLALILGADEEVCEIAGWFHDVIKTTTNPEDHNIRGAKKAEEELKKLGYPQKKIDKVKKAIIAHSIEGKAKTKTKEETVLKNADALAHFDYLNQLYWIVYGLKKMNVDEGKEWIEKRIDDYYKNLIPQARKLIKKRYDAMKIVLTDKT